MFEPVAQSQRINKALNPKMTQLADDLASIANELEVSLTSLYQYVALQILQTVPLARMAAARDDAAAVRHAEATMDDGYGSVDD